MGLSTQTHHRMLASPTEARRFFAALGCEAVAVRKVRPSSIEDLDTVVAAMPKATGFDDALAFIGGRLSDDALGALARLAVHPLGYLDTRTELACLRVWPHQTWVHAAFPQGGLEAASRLVGAPLGIGLTTLGELTVEVVEEKVVWPLHFRTPRVTLVLDHFRALAGAQHSRGHLTHVARETVEPLRAFLRALGAEVEASLTLSLDTASALIGELSSVPHEWWGKDVGVTFPSGVITGFTKLQEGEGAAVEWVARVDAALERAGL